MRTKEKNREKRKKTKRSLRDKGQREMGSRKEGVEATKKQKRGEMKERVR